MSQRLKGIAEVIKVMDSQAKRSLNIALMDLSLNERGNTWLVEEGTGGRQYFLSHLGDDLWLEITIVPVNYPGFSIRTITGTEEQMAVHIRKEWAGAFARRCNMEGVELDKESCVKGDESECETDAGIMGVCCSQPLTDAGRCEHCGWPGSPPL